jgi:hypothetical protein
VFHVEHARRQITEYPKELSVSIAFESRFHQPRVPLTKALALMKKIKQDTILHRYVRNTMLLCTE